MVEQTQYDVPRRHRRIPFHQEVEVVGVGVRRCTDISVGGLFLETVQSFATGERLHLRFKLTDGKDDPIDVTAVVRYAQEPVGAGVAFKDLAPEDVRRLEAFVDSGDNAPAA